MSTTYTIYVYVPTAIIGQQSVEQAGVSETRYIFRTGITTEQLPSLLRSCYTKYPHSRFEEVAEDSIDPTEQQLEPNPIDKAQLIQKHIPAPGGRFLVIKPESIHEIPTLNPTPFKPFR